MRTSKDKTFVHSQDVWFVERDGQKVALLREPQMQDMFWYSWRITPLLESRETLLSEAYWDESLLSRTVFRHRDLNHVAEAYWALPLGLREGDRIVMRGLYSVKTQMGFWVRLKRWLGGKSSCP